MAKIILDLYGGTGSWARPYSEHAGYIVHNITLPYYNALKTRIDKGKLLFCGGTSEPLRVATSSVYGILAAPPCTEFSSLTTSHRLPDFAEGLSHVKKCLWIIEQCASHCPKTLKFWALENPYARLRYFLGEPPLVFNPCDFGDKWTKKTCIWGLYNLPIKHPIKPSFTDFADVPITEENFGKLPEDYEIPHGWTKAQAIRSQTPQGFAKAFFRANR